MNTLETHCHPAAIHQMSICDPCPVCVMVIWAHAM